MNQPMTLEVTTYLFGLGAERRAPPVYIDLSERIVSARTLLAEHVRAEIARAQQCRTSSLALHYMLADAVRAVPEPPDLMPLDVESETTRAYTGLAERRYLLVVDGTMVADLDEQLMLTERSTVCFMRLPAAGWRLIHAHFIFGR